MKRRSRFLALTCAAVMMAFVLAGCSKPAAEDPVDTNPPEGNKETTYVIASDNSFPPFEYQDTTTNQFVGIDMDILAAIAEDQGFEYTVNNVGFDAAMGAVQSGQADGMIAGMSITEDREETFDFSDGYYENGQIMVVASASDIATLEDLNGKVVATKKNTMGTVFAEANADKYGYSTVSYDDSPAMYQAILNGNAVACFEDEAVVLYAIKTQNLELKTIGDVVGTQPYAFAVKKGDNAELLEKFNAGLKSIKENGKYDEIMDKYDKLLNKNGAGE